MLGETVGSGDSGDSVDERTWYLRQVDLFRGLTGEQIDALAGTLEAHTYGPGDLIIQPGRPEERIYVVRRGTVRLFHRSADGRELTADLVGPGRIFGVSTLFGASRDGLLAEAVTAATVCTAEGGDFLRLVSGWPQVMLNLIVQIGSQLMQTEQQLDRLVSADARGRLAATLYRLAFDGGENDADGGRRILTVLTHDALARQIGCSRETVTRTLAALETEGYIRREKRRITVTSLPRLARAFSLDEDPLATWLASAAGVQRNA
jgi:CRP-like cAMP-binding protein